MTESSKRDSSRGKISDRSENSNYFHLHFILRRAYRRPTTARSASLYILNTLLLHVCSVFFLVAFRFLGPLPLLDKHGVFFILYLFNVWTVGRAFGKKLHLTIFFLYCKRKKCVKFLIIIFYYLITGKYPILRSRKLIGIKVNVTINMNKWN